MSKQKAIFFLIAVLVVVAAAAVLIFHSIGADIREQMALTRSTAAVERVREKFMELTAPIKRDLELLSQWGESGLLGFSDIPSLNSKLIPLLNSLPTVAGLILTDTEGREYFLLKEGDSWLVRHAGKYHPDMTATIDRLDTSARLQETTSAKRTFDPRTRPWFAGALQMELPEEIYWTEPYTFKTLKKLGITAAVRWQAGNGDGTITVAAMDILLETLRLFLNEMQVMPGSQIILVRNDGMMMTSAPPGSGDGGIDFVDINKLPDSLKKDALAIWTNLRTQQTDTHRFSSQDSHWWVSFQPLQPESPKIWMGILIPEASLVSRMDQWWMPYALKFGVVMVLFVLLSGLVIWQYTRRHSMTAAHKEIDRESVQALIEAGEKPIVEFKSTLRTNLKNGKKDKAIELAWLKAATAFMNSDGGTLLVGVSDNGEICGIAADEFENEDKCLLHVKNLIHEHIGSEFAGFVQCRLHDFDGKTVVSLACRKAELPVFLKIGKNEDFFVRSGPSSTKLSMSQMVTYLEQRK